MGKIDYAQAASDFHEALDELQFGRTVSDGMFFLVEEDSLPIAEMVSRRMLVMQLAYILNRTLVLKPSEEPLVPEYFEPLGSITHEELAGLPARDASFDIEQREKVVRFDFESFWDNDRLRSYFYPWAPPNFASAKCPRLFFDGETLSRLRLTEHLVTRVDAEKGRNELNNRVLGLHVGSGNPLAGVPDAPLEMLVDEVDRIQSELGIERVLVTGADHDERSALPVGRGYAVADLELEPDGPARDLLELELLSACEWVVGRVTTDATRIAAARSGRRSMRCDRHRLVSAEPERQGWARFFGKKQ